MEAEKQSRPSFVLNPDFSSSVPSDSTAGGQDPELHLQWCLNYALPAGRQAQQLSPSSDVSSHSDGIYLPKRVDLLAFAVLLRCTFLVQLLFFDRAVFPILF